MRLMNGTARWAFIMLGAISFGPCAVQISAQSPTNPPAAVFVILEWEGTVEVMRVGTNVWEGARTNQSLFRGDRFRTRENSRALLRLAAGNTWRIDERSEMQVESPTDAHASVLLNVWRGLLRLFDRER